MIKIDDELAYQIHGIISSESDNDSDDREFDEEYHLLKPPPYNYELIKDKIIVISSQKTPTILNYWQNQSINIENNGKINKTETTDNAVVDNSIVLQATNVQNCNKKANSKQENLDLYGQASSSVLNSENCMVNVRVKSVDKISSRDKKTFRKSYAKSNDIRIIEKKNFGLNINTKEDLEKEFPSLDKVSKNNFKRKDKIIKEESIASTSIVSGKKKKQFKPLPIEINYSKDIPNVEYVKISKKNRKKEIKGTTINKININIPAVRNEINDNKRKIRKIRKIPKQSVKILVTKNLIDKTNSIEDTTNQIKEAKNDNKTQIQGTEVLANDVGFQEIKSSELNFEDSIPLYREERESTMFNNMSNKIVATNLMDFEEESYTINGITDKKIKGTSKLTQSISEMECINSFQAVTQNIKINENKIKTRKPYNENLPNISIGQRVQKNLNQTNDIQENINPGIGKVNSSINLELEPSANDHRDVVEYENIFDAEFKNFLQNIDYEGTGITDLNSFTYEQLHLAYTAYLRKDAMENSFAENIVKNTSPQKKKPTKKKKKVKQPTAKLRHCNKLYQQNKDDSIMIGETYFFKNEYEEFNAMACSYDLIYDELIDFMACTQEIQNINTNGSIIYLSAVNINFYLGMKSLTYISTRFTNDRKNYAYISKRTHSTKINEKIKNTHWEFGSKILKDILLHVIPQLF